MVEGHLTMPTVSRFKGVLQAFHSLEARIGSPIPIKMLPDSRVPPVYVTHRLESLRFHPLSRRVRQTLFPLVLPVELMLGGP